MKYVTLNQDDDNDDIRLCFATVSTCEDPSISKNEALGLATLVDIISIFYLPDIDFLYAVLGLIVLLYIG